MKKIKLSIASCAFALSASANAAVIVWSGPVDATIAPTLGSDTLIEAINAGGVAVSNVGPDNINFEDGNGSVSSDFSNLETAFTSTPSSSGGVVGFNATIGDTHRWLPGTNPATFVLDNLSADTTYRIQLGFFDLRGGSGPRSYTFNDGNGNSTAPFSRNDLDYFIGTFTTGAAETTQTINMVPVDPAATNIDPGISFYVLSEVNSVPEPSSMLFLGLGGLAFVARRKRS